MNLAGLPLVGFLQTQNAATKVQKIVEYECPAVLLECGTSQKLGQRAPIIRTTWIHLCTNLYTDSRDIDLGRDI